MMKLDKILSKPHQNIEDVKIETVCESELESLPKYVTVRDFA